MLAKIRRVINKIKLRIYDRDSLEYNLIMLNLEYENDIEKHNNNIFFKKLNLNMSLNQSFFMILGYKNALLLKDVVDATFILDNNYLYIELNDLKFKIQTAEELFILREIFVDGIYNFCLNSNLDKYILIDIGMNVSFASCYFGRVKKIPKIISFEPFKPTFIEAKENIRLNSLENTIYANNYGLGDTDESLSVEYTEEFKGQVGVQGVDYIRSKIDKKIVENIIIKDVNKVFNTMFKDFKTNRFILKIDCEGAEYQLIDNIPQNILDRCDIIMMEWHEKGAQKLEDWLIFNNFMLMSFSPHSTRVGMIYAIKNKI